MAASNRSQNSHHMRKMFYQDDVSRTNCENCQTRSARKEITTFFPHREQISLLVLNYTQFKTAVKKFHTFTNFSLSNKIYRVSSIIHMNKICPLFMSYRGEWINLIASLLKCTCKCFLKTFWNNISLFAFSFY